MTAPEKNKALKSCEKNAGLAALYLGRCFDDMVRARSEGATLFEIAQMSGYSPQGIGKALERGSLNHVANRVDNEDEGE